ncbi:hypothetical protein KPL71_009654 [Citrus sinensis]|uniref:Uncharacterized protein n=1 Tax=Citrus sinensis TaxID=2711 RepID=A0ACB8MFW9_CITSI|nr:hypothetical protein KPL71_009654 [Citrus sinensis]
MKLSLKLPDDSQNTQNPPILKDSPLIFSAHFSLSYTNPTNFTPTFFPHFKPQFGNFSLHKTTSSSNPNPANSGPHLQSGSLSNTEFANRSILDESSEWQDLKLEPRNGNGNGSFFNGVDSIRSDGIGFVRDRTSLLKDDDKKSGFLGGIAIKARTMLPVTKRVMMNLRWGVNLPADFEVKMPYLTVNKIRIERVEKVEEVKREKNIESDVGDLELLKGMLC